MASKWLSNCFFSSLFEIINHVFIKSEVTLHFTFLMFSFLFQPLPTRIILLLLLFFKLVAGVAGTDRNLRLIPVSILLQSIQNVLSIRLNQVCPGLPQGMDDIVNETNL